MSKGLAITLLVVGVLLIAFGISTSESFTADVIRLTNTQGDRTLWFIGGGIALSFIGIYSLMCHPQK